MAVKHKAKSARATRKERKHTPIAHLDHIKFVSAAVFRRAQDRDGITSQTDMHCRLVLAGSSAGYLALPHFLQRAHVVAADPPARGCAFVSSSCWADVLHLM